MDVALGVLFLESGLRMEVNCPEPAWGPCDHEFKTNHGSNSTRFISGLARFIASPATSRLCERVDRV